MIWFIIGLVIAVAIIIYNVRCDELYDSQLSMPILLISFLISLLISFFVSVVINCSAEIEYNVISDTKIVALKDNQNISGNFYIMGGYVEEDLYYYYATETELGYQIEKIPANNAYIRYTDGETHIEKCERKFANKSTNLWAFPMGDDIYIIYCPEGTVTNEFNVDLE